jgi:hypothetical protein
MPRKPGISPINISTPADLSSPPVRFVCIVKHYSTPINIVYGASMAKSNAWQTDLLELLFNNTTVAGVGDTTGLVGSTGVGSLYVSLHTADPTAAGNQTSNETTYTGYARLAIARTSGAWAVSGDSPATVSNAAIAIFNTCTGGSPSTITYVGIGTAVSGAGVLLYSGALGSSLAVSQNISPTFNIGQLLISED